MSWQRRRQRAELAVSTGTSRERRRGVAELHRAIAGIWRAEVDALAAEGRRVPYAVTDAVDRALAEAAAIDAQLAADDEREERGRTATRAQRWSRL